MQSFRKVSNSIRGSFLTINKTGSASKCRGWFRDSRLLDKTRSNYSTSVRPESKKYLLLLIVPSSAFCLGTWQVYRLQWKKNLIKELELRGDARPIDLPNDFSQLQGLEYRRVIVRGYFDHTKELFLGPRAMTDESPNLRQPKSGYNVITPFQVAETEEHILVNRGWVPREQINAETRKEGQVEGLVEFVAVVRKHEKRPQFMIRNQPEKNRWHFYDVETMAALTGTQPVLLDADAESSIPGGPVGGQTQFKVRNEHLQYILTWYSLAAATIFMYYRMRKNPAAML